MNYKKDGMCPATCGKCCTSILPLSKKEIKDIDKYIKDNEIKCNNKNTCFSKEYVDRCPFLKDNNRCGIYEIRPEICRKYECDNAFGLSGLNFKNKNIVNLFTEFYPGEYLYCPPDINELNEKYQKACKKAKIK